MGCIINETRQGISREQNFYERNEFYFNNIQITSADDLAVSYMYNVYRHPLYT